MINSIKEAFAPIVPIAALVVVLHWMTGFMQPGYMAYWLVGSFLAGTGLLFFLRGVDLCLIPMGELIGKRFLFLPGMIALCIVVFLIGFLACMADPSVAVLNREVAKVAGGSGPPAWAVMAVVMSGIGVLLLAAILRIVWNIHPAQMLGGIVILALILAVISTLVGVEDFVPLALDSGGVATGPLTVPFFLAIGLGFVSNIAGRSASTDGFGLLGIVVWGPILGVLLLGLAWGKGTEPQPEDHDHNHDLPVTALVEPHIETHNDTDTDHADLAEPEPPPTFSTVLRNFVQLGETTIGVLQGLVPLLIIGWGIGVVPSKVSREYQMKLLMGAFWTLLGLIVFLQAVNIGFAPVAEQLGCSLAGIWSGWALVPAGLLLGLSVGLAEPSVHVLCKQVEEVTDGAIPGKLLLVLMACGVALAGAIGMTKLVLGLSILWIVIPGYIIIIALSYFCSKMFASIAYDASTVVTGPVLVAFLMILVANAADPLGRDPLLDGFGFVATVAMVPILVVMAMGAYVERRKR
ncbi:MAG: DUF1538 domain-containing protein [Planctomycetaceae bacterium]|nr:DUF1538 domain-containing protein [Planctomycetaceae bacterium]